MAKIRIFIWSILLLCLGSCKRVPKNDLGPELAINTPEVFAIDTTAEVYFDTTAQTITADESLIEVQEVVLPEQKPTIQEIYSSQVGVRELTGKNDGPEVEMYLKTVGLGKGYSWCSAFVKWSLDEAEIPNKINAWSPTAENKKNIIYQARRFVAEPEPGDVFTIWFPRMKRIGHTGFFDGRQNEKIIVTVEGNTNEAGSREGDGVYKKYRSLKTIHTISRWP